MSLLFRIVYAAHANGTHHKLALDALRHLHGSEAEGWRRLFLQNAKHYLDGAKAPDNEFKDFKNHVLHVRDGYWGGALEAVERWYGELVAALSRQSWPEAVRAAGILSHYICDPVHPFHTSQSEAENNIHRACEWSISKSYDDLRRIAETGAPQLEVTVPSGPTWLRELMCRSAEIANANYERLIAHYDIHRGVSDPPTGLDSVARGLLADLILYAARINAAVLDRALSAAGVSPPAVSLTAETLIAGLEIPKKWILRKLADAEDRRLVEAMYDELKTTGRVEQTLPADDRMVRDLHQVEVLAAQLAAREQQRAKVVAAARPLSPPAAIAPAATPVAAQPPLPAAPVPATLVPATPVPAAPVPAEPVRDVQSTVSVPPPRPLVATVPPPPPPFPPPKVPPSTGSVPTLPALPLLKGGPPPASVPVLAPAGTIAEPVKTPAPPVIPVVAGSRAAAFAPLRAAAAPVPASSHPTAVSAPPEPVRDGGATVHLQPGDPLERAPSIGPKTAERLAVHGIVTVADFLAADPVVLAGKLDARHMTADVLVAWKDQARLVMQVPGLRGGQAQLLVGSGYRTPQAIAATAPDKLCADVLAYAATSDGQRLLRDGAPPDIARIKSWIELAAAAAKAA